MTFRFSLLILTCSVVCQTEHCRASVTQSEMEGKPPLNSTRPKQIFILSGQSNMSGRGGVLDDQWDHYVPPESQSSSSILRFSAKSQWLLAQEPLHADIDVNKTCGVGPGMPFANSLPRLPPTVVGLVPCAVGGTAIAEWERGKPLYNQMIARATAALEAGGGEIKAVLWYQGESDTDAQSKADVYKTKMEKLIADVRGDLDLPSLPFVQVALASGFDETLVRQVREAQLAINMPNVVSVDAMGLPLNSDHLHLTTDAQVTLGKMLAHAYLTHFFRGGAIRSSSTRHSPMISMSRCEFPITSPAASWVNVGPQQRNIFARLGMGKIFSSCWNHHKPNGCWSFEPHDLEICDYRKDFPLDTLSVFLDSDAKSRVIVSATLSMQMEEQLIQTSWSSCWFFKASLPVLLFLFTWIVVVLL